MLEDLLPVFLVAWALAALVAGVLFVLRKRRPAPGSDVVAALAIAETLAPTGGGARVKDLGLALVLDDAIVAPDPDARAKLLFAIHAVTSSARNASELEELFFRAASRAKAARRKHHTLEDCLQELVAHGGQVAELLRDAGIRFGERATQSASPTAPGGPYRGDDPTARVVFWNDDQTSMEFVNEILMEELGKTPFDAFSLMIAVHHRGSAVVGEYPREDALARVARVEARAQKLGFPLRVTVAT